MLRQKQAPLLNAVYKSVANEKGTKAAEDLLLSLLDSDATSRVSISKYFSSFLQKDAYVNIHLNNDSLWLEHLNDVLLTELIHKYEELGSWKPI